MKDALQIITLLLVMGGIFALSWLATRFLAKRLPGGGKTGHMHIIERLPLGRDRQVALLKVGEDHILVGITGQKISFSGPVRLQSLNYAQVQEMVDNDHGNNNSSEEN